MQALPWLALERLQIPSDLGSLWGGEGIKSTQQAFRHEGGFRFTFTDLDSALFLSSLPNIKIQGWVRFLDPPLMNRPLTHTGENATTAKPTSVDQPGRIRFHLLVTMVDIVT